MIDGNQHPPIDVPGQGQLQARLTTSKGVIDIVLYEHEAPNTVANFVGLATGRKTYIDPRSGQTSNAPYYHGTTFHRVIPNFMVQAGDPTATGRGGPGFDFRDEFNPQLRHDQAGTLSMANAGPNTNGSQFFITDAATPHLDNRHAVFGRVTSGLDVVRAIARVPTDQRDKPIEPVVLQSVDLYRA